MPLSSCTIWYYTKKVTCISKQVHSFHFSAFEVVSNKCANKQSKKGISPNAHLGDGTMDVVLMHKTIFPRLTALLLVLLHKTNSNRFKYDFVEAFRAINCTIAIPVPSGQKADKAETETGFTKSNASLSNSASPLLDDRHTNYGDNSPNQSCCEINPNNAKPQNKNSTKQQKPTKAAGPILDLGDADDSRKQARNSNLLENMNVNNLNALWNIDGETCEADFFRLQPERQFIQLYATKPSHSN